MLLPLLADTAEFFPPGRALVLFLLVTIFLWFRSKLARQKLISPVPGVKVAPGAHWLFGHINYMFGPPEDGDKDNFAHLFVNHANEQGLSCAYYFREYFVDV